MRFEFLYNYSCGPVNVAIVEADSLLESEDKFKKQFPAAVYWEIGVPDGDDSNDEPIKGD